MSLLASPPSLPFGITSQANGQKDRNTSATASTAAHAVLDEVEHSADRHLCDEATSHDDLPGGDRPDRLLTYKHSTYGSHVCMQVRWIAMRREV